MGTINSAFSLIRGALEADQSALSIAAGNVANANTPGYTAESPAWRENAPVILNGATFGTGVSETGAVSKRDRVLLQRINQQQQLASESSARLSALSTVETLFTPNSGSSSGGAGDIGADLTKFFGSFSALEASPTNNALRQQVLSSASTLAADVSHASRSITQQISTLDQEAASMAGQVNALTASIAQLNVEIQSQATEVAPLEDQRQQDILALSKLIGIRQVTTENNGLTITTMAGETLVSQGSSTPLTTGLVGSVTHFFLNGKDITPPNQTPPVAGLRDGGGELGGLLTARDGDLPSVLDGLDQLAYTISTQVNAQNAAGSGLGAYSAAGAALFAAPAQQSGSAGSMAVQLTDPDGIAAASLNAGNGDNHNAIQLANLGASAQALLNGHTPSAFFSGFVTSLGSTIAQLKTENTAQNASVSQLQSQSDALSAVNLNDEAAAITTLERSYQAASQVFNILEHLMATALNLGLQSTVS